MHVPIFIHLLFEIPMTAAFLAGGEEDRVGLIPFPGERALPHRLRLGAHKNIFAEAFELQAVAAIEQGIVLPARGFEKCEGELIGHNN